MARLPRVSFGPLTVGEHALHGAEAKYLGRVHRMAVGDRFVAFDPEAVLEAEGTIVSFSKSSVSFRLGPPRSATRVPPVELTLLQALGKGDKPDRVIRDATALGASHVVLVETSRVVPRPGERTPHRRDRFRRIAVDAARQCGRGNVPDIDGPEDLDAALERAAAGAARFVLDPEGSRRLIVALQDLPQERGVVLLVGPEGGLTPSEHARAVSAEFEPVRLGPFVLRTETAAVAALAVVTARW